jgi:short-subunit dehydrogenase
MTSIEGRTALVTGASGGIGQAIARRLSRDGADVVVTGRRRGELEDLASVLGARAIVADLTDPADVERLVDDAGPIDLLVANAGLSSDGAIESFGRDDLRDSIEVNLTVPIELTRALLPGMRARGSGHLVYISSVSGHVPTPFSSIYATTKFGLRGFAHSVRQELHGSGVGVSLVSPGFISDAGMWANTGLDLPPGLGTKTPDDVAAAVVRAITRNRRDIVVASALQRMGVPLYALFPGAMATIMRLGGNDLPERMVEANDRRRGTSRLPESSGG